MSSDCRSQRYFWLFLTTKLRVGSESKAWGVTPFHNCSSCSELTVPWQRDIDTAALLHWILLRLLAGRKMPGVLEVFGNMPIWSLSPFRSLRPAERNSDRLKPSKIAGGFSVGNVFQLWHVHSDNVYRPYLLGLPALLLSVLYSLWPLGSRHHDHWFQWKEGLMYHLYLAVDRIWPTSFVLMCSTEMPFSLAMIFDSWYVYLLCL